MNKELIISETEQFINDEIFYIQIEYGEKETANERFYLNTAKRLTKAYSLYKKNNIFKNDYILALRDFLITFDVSVRINQNEFLKNNKFGISFDDVERKYFASYQLSFDVNEKFVKEAFLREIQNKKSGNDNDNLTTDPMILNLTGYSKFKSLGQKLAVYGALNTPEGFTTLVSLPTGGGKSLITQTIAFQKEGLTIVIVPTVSLAIDQERVTKEIIKRDNKDGEIFSYSSGVDAEPILSAIKKKNARMLFISPEALLENPAFAKVIREANKDRYLKNIVIDEAHIVVDWGAAFRVDYQCLEAWRNMLLMTNPSLRTILLSATFEDKCVEILKNFFEVSGRWIEIRCDALRHEPRYSVVRLRNNSEKQKCLIEMVRKLPHPMIIYVARPLDADNIKKSLANVGINNVRTFTGLTGKSQRKKLIDEWVDNEYEIIIATSAFGVGVDKSDVRTVIHTYIPQNANTYYQELGRGGRDCLPCLSVMCLQPEDTTIGRDRIIKKVLTSEKIIGRWDSLYNNRKSVRLSDNRVFIDTSIKPNYAEVDEFDDSPTSDADMNWNVYVLLFLRRYRDEMAVVTRNVIWNIEFLNTYTDKEKDILGKYSSSLFTLNTFYTANKSIVGRNDVSESEHFLLNFWTLVAKHMKLWQELQNREITKVDLRENFIATQSIVIQAFGRVGSYLYLHQNEMEKTMANIEKINWSRNARQWYMRAVGKNGRIITNKKAALLIANVIKQQIGIPLSQEELNAEEALKKIIEE